MPIVTVQMLEGRTDDQKRELVEKVTEAVTSSTKAPADRVTVVIEEMKPENLGKGGVRASDEA